jgi:hypothetical protein
MQKIFSKLNKLKNKTAVRTAGDGGVLTLQFTLTGLVERRSIRRNYNRRQSLKTKITVCIKLSIFGLKNIISSLFMDALGDLFG